MIIDLILDRADEKREGKESYNPHRFYTDCIRYGSIGDGITRAMDGGTEHDVKRELCSYIVHGDYNLDICNFILSVDWISSTSSSTAADVGNR